MIADDAVGADQLASSAVVTASIVDDAVTAAKLSATIKQQVFTVADSSTTNFDLAVTLDASHNKPLVYRNGLALAPSSDSDNDSYTVSLTGGSGGVTRVSLGANAENGDIVMIVFIS
jgi:DeoR/GlpR family transcriptional regulator of sugar metabolism